MPLGHLSPALVPPCWIRDPASLPEPTLCLGASLRPFQTHATLARCQIGKTILGDENILDMFPRGIWTFASLSAFCFKDGTSWFHWIWQDSCRPWFLKLQMMWGLLPRCTHCCLHYNCTHQNVHLIWVHFILYKLYLSKLELRREQVRFIYVILGGYVWYSIKIYFGMKKKASCRAMSKDNIFCG